MSLLVGFSIIQYVTVYLIFKSYCFNLRIPYFIFQSQTIRASIPEEAIPASSKPSSAKGLPPKDVIEHVCPEFSLSSLRVAMNSKKVCVRVCVCVCAWVHACMRTCVCSVVQCECVCVCVRTYVRTCMRTCVCSVVQCVCAYMRACMCECTCVCVGVRLCMCLCLRVRAYAHEHMHMSVCLMLRDILVLVFLDVVLL